MASRLAGKIVFFDFDGVLCTYQATENKVHVPPNKYLERSINTSYTEVYRYSRAPETMKKLVARLKSDNIYLLTQVDVVQEFRNKIEFMHQYYPNVKDENMLFVAKSAYKVDMMENLYKSKYLGKMGRESLVLIEDTISVIEAVEDAGFTCIHNSSFIS